MKKLLFALAGMGLLVSCNELDGTLSVTKAFTMKLEKSSVTVPVGNHQAAIQYDESDREIEFEIKDLNGDKDAKSKFRIPSGKSIPRDNGTFTLTAQEIGQAFDFTGEIKTDFERSERYRETESCTYQRPERVCYREYDPRTGRYYSRCYTEYRTYYGYRDVEYHFEITHRAVMAEFVTAGTDELLGQFSSERTDRERIYDHTGYCR